MADYDAGGWLQPGTGTVANMTAAPELVISYDASCTCSHTASYEVDDSGDRPLLRPVVVRRPGTGCPEHGNT